MTEPVIAIIIPVFRHSVLMTDAVESALSQCASFAIQVVIVNDGCPHPETEEIGLAYARVHPTLTYLKMQHGGLSSARNHGIEHILFHLPSVRAIYMLDADNRLRPRAMARAMEALDADPEAGWIYPDVDMVGLAKAHDYSGPYSVLLHTSMNICEAGSLVRREVFESGVMYDTSFKTGFEDWDFFLSAVRAGFRGKHIEGFGFLYRKRPESMLADSERERESILTKLRTKHADLFAPRHLLELEQKEAPRYAFILTDLNEVRFTTDPLAQALILSQEEFSQRFWAAQWSPGRHPMPPITVITTSDALADAQAAGMLHGILWQLECFAGMTNIGGLSAITGHVDRMGLRVLPPGFKEPDEAAIILLSTALLASFAAISSSSFLFESSIAEPQTKLIFAVATLPPALPSPALARGGAYTGLLSVTNLLRISPYAQAAVAFVDWREPDLKARADTHMILRNRFGCQPTLPLLRREGRHIGLLLSIIEFGGVEKVALNYAREFAANGWSVHLFVIGQREAAIDAEWRASVRSVNFIYDPDFTPWGGGEKRYFGTEVPGWTSYGNQARLVAALHWLDVVVEFHSGAAMAAMARLRKAGVITVTSQHVIDLSPVGRPTGSPFLALAYEHAFDFFAPCSLKLGEWLHAMGVPEDKIFPVPNAPSFGIKPDRLRELLDARDRRSIDRINVLYLGRLDSQKGLDRIAELIDITSHLPLDWRIIGKSVVGDRPLPSILSDLLEPPLYVPEQLIDALSSSDLLIMMSEYEGLPLTILEAMRQGVVPISTNVGAVSEAINDGVSGYLLNPAGAVRECAATMTRLCEDPLMLRKLSASSASQSSQRSWARSLAPLHTALEEALLLDRDRLFPDLSVPWCPSEPVPDPDLFEMVDLTPRNWSDPSKEILDSKITLQRYEPFGGFIQFGVPEGSPVVMNAAFRQFSTESRRGAKLLSLTPVGDPSGWFTYEIIVKDVDFSAFHGLDFSLRYVLSRPRDVYSQFILDGSGENLRLEAGTLKARDAGIGFKTSLSLAGLSEGTLERLNMVRLVLFLGEDIADLSLMELSIVGRRALRLW